jgi:hypothetical protein
MRPSPRSPARHFTRQYPGRSAPFPRRVGVLHDKEPDSRPGSPQSPAAHTSHMPHQHRTEIASARAPKLRCAPSRLASRPGGAGHPARRQGRPGPGRTTVPCRNAAHRRTRQRRSTRTLSKHHRAHPARAPYHHSAQPGGPAPTGLCTATRNACSEIQNRSDRRIGICHCLARCGRRGAQITHSVRGSVSS